MVQSMTGFASAQGAGETYQWMWDLRSVNAKGLDIRVRAPDWIPSLEAEIKTRIGKSVARGSINANLRIVRSRQENAQNLNEDQLDVTLKALARVQELAQQNNVYLTETTAGEILSLKGVMDASGGDDDAADIRTEVLAAFDQILQEFVSMRNAEGKSLKAVLGDQIDQIAALVEQAKGIVEQRKSDMDASFRAALARVVDAASVDQDRVAQEIALLSVKTDITEELDRLDAHISAARALLDEGARIGRKLDFLSQEFNREANTLCSKSQHKELTAVGLELKAVIDQMREQVQNVE